jgi:hypothetical protein
MTRTGGFNTNWIARGILPRRETALEKIETRRMMVWIAITTTIESPTAAQT